jgi:hypothetical protein
MRSAALVSAASVERGNSQSKHCARVDVFLVDALAACELLKGNKKRTLLTLKLISELNAALSA